MQKLQIAICDDDVEILQVVAGSIRTEFARYDYAAGIDLFGTPAALKRRMKEKTYDLLFLDIEMPGEDGISLARRLRKNGWARDIIFISSREDKVFDALRTGPNGFIRKKRFLTDVPEVIQTYVHSMHRQDSGKHLVIQSREESVSVDIENIIYIEGQRKIQLLYLAEKEKPLELHRSMQDLEDTLSPEGFLRIHKGYLVNYRYIRHINSTDVELTTGQNLPLSRRRVQEIRDAYLALMQKDSGGIVML